MAEGKGLNSLQLAGLLGTTTSGLLSASNIYTQGQFGKLGANIQAGGILANSNLQIGSSISNADLQISSSLANAKFQEGAALANANLEASRGLTSADLLVSELNATTLLRTTQTGIESDLQKILRAQQAQDLEYQSDRLELDADIIGTQIELSKAAASEKEKQLLRSLNKSEVNTVLAAVAQGRSGATVSNLRAQDRARADREVELAKETGRVEQANLSIQAQQALGDSKVASLASRSVEAVSAFEQSSAQIQIDYLNTTTNAKTSFIKDSAAAEAVFGKTLALNEAKRFTEATQTQADYLKEITALQTNYTKESSVLNAQTIKTQAQAAAKIATVSALTGAITSVASGYSQYKVIA